MGVTIRTAQRLYIRYDISEMPESIESMELKNKFDNSEIVTGTIIRRIKGGMIVATNLALMFFIQLMQMILFLMVN